MVRKLVLAFVAAALSAGPAFAQEVTLRAISAFQEGTAFSKPFEDFVKKVNEDGKGVIRINFIGGPRAMPPSPCATGRPGPWTRPCGPSRARSPPGGPPRAC